jgi:hypothetical protein
MDQLLQKIKAIIASLNEKGIPTPIMRDMVTNKPSITYTMMLVSFVLTVLASFKLGEDKLGLNFDQCLQLLSYVGIGYVGRKFQKGSLTVEGKDNTENENTKQN